MQMPRPNMIRRIHHRSVSSADDREDHRHHRHAEHAPEDEAARPDAVIEPTDELARHDHADRLRERGEARLQRGQARGAPAGTAAGCRARPTKLPYVSVSTMFALRNMRSSVQPQREHRRTRRASPPRRAARTARRRRSPVDEHRRPNATPSPGLPRARTTRARARRPTARSPARSKRPGRALSVFAEVERAEHETDHADRQVDVEDPAPRDVGDEPAADDRARARARARSG